MKPGAIVGETIVKCYDYCTLASPSRQEQSRDSSPTVSPQSAKIVGPGNVPLTRRTLRETPSRAAVVLTSSK
jgi:hypothetical protein